MAGWKYKIEMRGTLDLEPAAAAEALVRRLRDLPPAFRERQYGGDSLDELIEQLEEVVDLGDLAEVRDFNGALHEIYNWADYHGLWIYLTAEAA